MIKKYQVDILLNQKLFTLIKSRRTKGWRRNASISLEMDAKLQQHMSYINQGIRYICFDVT